VVGAKAWMSAERVGHPGERLAEMLGYHLLVRDVVGDLSQSVHVVRECDQTGPHLVLGEDAECMAYDGGAGDFAERTDMRQARWAITGLEDHLVLGYCVSRATILRASSNGQAFDCSASVRRPAASASIAALRFSDPPSSLI